MRSLGPTLALCVGMAISGCEECGTPAIESVPFGEAVMTDATASRRELMIDRMLENKKLAIGTVKVGKTVISKVKAAEREIKIDRVEENLRAELRSAFQNSQMFQLVGRQNADTLAKEDTATRQTFAFDQADYLLVVDVDDFKDEIEATHLAARGKSVTFHRVSFTGTSTLFDTRTREAVETSNISVSRTALEEQRDAPKGETREAHLLELTKELAEKTAQHFADFLYPALILDKTDKTVTLNRGEALGIAIGQLWEVFAVADQIKDPDSGMILGSEEVSVGKIRVSRVTAKTSQAVVIEDSGIVRGAIIRRVVP